MTAASMLAAARWDLGLAGRPNRVTREYAARHGGAFLRAPWCNMSVTHWARESGNTAAVLPDGDRAYTVWHAQDGQRLGRWYAGTATNIRAHARPGAIVFFDWAGTDQVGAIDHVGVVELVLDDGRVQTIEGNTADACKRRVRGPSVIAGFWNPPYEKSPASTRPKPPTTWLEELVKDLPLLKVGAKGTAVKRAFYLLTSHGFGLDPEVFDDMEYTPAMGVKVAAFQKAKGKKVDKQIGRQTWAALIAP